MLFHTYYFLLWQWEVAASLALRGVPLVGWYLESLLCIPVEGQTQDQPLLYWCFPQDSFLCHLSRNQMEYLLPVYYMGVENCRLKIVWNSLWRGGIKWENARNSEHKVFVEVPALWRRMTRCQGGCLIQAEILYQVRHVTNIPNSFHSIAGGCEVCCF